MKVYEETGKTKTGELSITRSIQSLLIGCTSIAALTNESISCFIETDTGKNKNIAINVPLLDFILGSTYGEDGGVVFGETGKLDYARCELSEEGSIALGENESIKVEMKNLKAASTYSINGIEAPITSSTVVKFEVKKITDGEVTKDLIVTDYENVIIDGVSAIDEVHFTWTNGTVTKHLPEELFAISRDVDHSAYVVEGGAMNSTISNRLQLPLIGVVGLEIFKGSGVVTLVVRDEQNLN